MPCEPERSGFHEVHPLVIAIGHLAHLPLVREELLDLMGITGHRNVVSSGLIDELLCNGARCQLPRKLNYGAK